MKKIVAFLTTLIIAITVLAIPSTGHAMNQKDLAGKVYLVTFNKTSSTSKPSYAYYFFNNNGKAAFEYVPGFNDDGSPAIDMNNATQNEKKAPKRVNKLLTNKKYFTNRCKEDNAFKLKNNVARFDNGFIVGDTKWKLQDGGTPNDFTFKCLGDDGEYSDAHFQLAPQNYQYKFKW